LNPSLKRLFLCIAVLSKPQPFKMLLEGDMYRVLSSNETDS